MRQTVAERYGRLFAGLEGIELPKIPENYKSVWAQYSLLARDGQHRAALQSRLQKSGVPTAIYYPKPLHLQTAFSFLGYSTGDFPVSEDCSQRIFSLPMHPYLTASDQEKIADVFIKAVKHIELSVFTAKPVPIFVGLRSRRKGHRGFPFLLSAERSKSKKKPVHCNTYIRFC